MNLTSLFGFFNNTAVGEVYDENYKFVPTDQMLSQSELQMLQRIVSERIFLEECYLVDIKENAKHQRVQSVRDVYYKEAKKISLKIKKLSALQYRLKHKIAARG